MDENYVKDMLEDIRNMAEHQDINGIIAMCENEIEALSQRAIKQDIFNLLRIIVNAKYETTKFRGKNTDELYNLLNEASEILRNLVIRKELNTQSANENV